MAAPKIHEIQARCHCLRLAVEMRREGETVGHILTRARLLERYVLQAAGNRHMPIITSEMIESCVAEYLDWEKSEEYSVDKLVERILLHALGHAVEKENPATSRPSSA